MKKKGILTMILLASYVIIAVLFYSSGLVGQATREGLVDSVFLIAPVFSLVSGIHAARKYGMKSVHGKTLFHLTTGIFLWFMGEFTWLVYNSLGMDPFPSIADIFFLVAYPFLLYGIINELKLGKISWARKRSIITLAFISLLSITTIFFGVGAYNQDSPLLENTISISYMVADLVIVAGLVLLVNISMEFKGGFLYKAWMLFALGMFLTWMGDIIYAIYTSEY